MEGQNYKCRG